MNQDYYRGYGYPERVAGQVLGSRFLSPSQEGTNVAVFPEDAQGQGIVWDSTEEDLAGKVYLADVPVGKENVILFSDDPTFRAHWRGLDKPPSQSAIRPHQPRK